MRLIALRSMSISPTRKVRMHEEFEVSDEIGQRYLTRQLARPIEQPAPVAKPKKRKASRTKRVASPTPETSDLPAVDPDAPGDPQA